MLKLAVALAGAVGAQASILDVVVARTDLSTLVEVVSQTSSTVDFTVITNILDTETISAFLPDNDAFAAFQTETGVDCLVEANHQACFDVIAYHVIKESVNINPTAVGSTKYETFSENIGDTNLPDGTGQALLVTTSGVDPITLKWGLSGESNVSLALDESANGFPYIINSVIYPPPSSASDTAVAGGLNALASALGAADLLETVDSTAGVTVFAPMDSAFAAIESETSRLTIEELSSVLTAHVVSPSVIYAQDVPGGDGATVTTLNAAVELNAVSSDSVSVSVVGSDAPASSVTIADIVTANGVVHVIDRVLLPTALALPSSLSIANNLGRVPELSRLATIVGSDTAYGDVVTALDGGAADAWTLFAPSDAAFAAFEVDGVNCATGDAAMKALCKGTFFYHAVGTKIEAGDIADGTTLVKSAATSSSAPDLVNLGDDGQVLKVVKSGGGVTVNGVNVVTTDIACGNGVIHIIDSVIGLPDSLAATAASNTDLSTLATVLENTDLLDTVDTTASITVFAPTDAAFSVLASEDQDTYDACVSENDIELAACGNILKYHVVPGAVKFASDILAEAPLTLETLAVSDDESSSVKVTVEGGEVIISDKAGNEAKVTDADVVVRNGVVHIIDSVLLLDSASVAQVSGALVALIAVVSAILV